MAATIRRRMLMTGARHALAPVLDIARDPRWGRIEETYGEDPYLAAELGCAYITALQGPDLADGVIATGKHMVGHGLAEGGLNQAPAHIGPRELRDEQLFPFEAAVRWAGIASIMPAYCDLDGVPCHASTELLDGILRGEWGFDGIIASDYIGVEMIATAHRLTADLGEAARLALAAGVDVELPRTAAYGVPLEAAIADGRVDDRLLDTTVARVLRMKFRLGLFDRPYVDVPAESTLEDLAVDESRAARTLAERSIVLVENDGLLPLAARHRRVAVIGPIADSARDLLGDYSHVVHMETLREMQAGGNALGIVTDGDLVDADDELSGRRTILDAVRASLVGAEVRHARGTGISDGTDDEIAAAVELAGGSDVSIVVLGERSGLTDDSTTGEFRDRSSLGFIGPPAGAAGGRRRDWHTGRAGRRQRAAAGDRVGRRALRRHPPGVGPRRRGSGRDRRRPDRGDEPGRQAARLGPASGRPGADHLSPPSDRRSLAAEGRLRRWPGRRRCGHSDVACHTRRSGSIACASLTTRSPRADGELTVSVDIENTGQRPGDEVIQLYVRDVEASVARPVLELRGFRRVSLLPGERRTVSFMMSAEQFAYVGADHRRVVEPGAITIHIGTSSVDLPTDRHDPTRRTDGRAASTGIAI